MNKLNIFCYLRSCGYDHAVITDSSDIQGRAQKLEKKGGRNLKPNIEEQKSHQASDVQFLVELVKQYSNVSDLVFFFFFELQYMDHFCVKSFRLFPAEGLRDQEQLRVQERHCPANKI